MGVVSCGLAVVLACGALCRPAAADDDRRLEESYSARGVHTLRLDVPVGEVHLEGTGDDEVAVKAEIRCTDDGRRCREALRQVRLDTATAGGELKIGLENWPKTGGPGALELEMRVRLPRALALAAKLGVGEFHAAALAGDLTISVGVGEIEVTRPEAGVKRVKADVGVGGATLSVGRREIEGSGFLGRTIDWKGDGGTATIAVDCGVGEVTVVLE
jgi:hypothetical protein